MTYGPSWMLPVMDAVHQIEGERDMFAQLRPICTQLMEHAKRLAEDVRQHIRLESSQSRKNMLAAHGQGSTGRHDMCIYP
jgi:hypothetical protein